MDRCKNCSARGNLIVCNKVCFSGDCDVLESWGVSARLKALDEEITKLREERKDREPEEKTEWICRFCGTVVVVDSKKMNAELDLYQKAQACVKCVCERVNAAFDGEE